MDVQGAFGSAWWPAILKGLREADCPHNLYYLTKNYLKERKATITINNINREMEITKGCPPGSCCGPGLWNIQFDPVLKLQYTKHTKVVAFADDLLLMVRDDSVGEAENIANVELNKISKWANDNKLRFNEGKSKVMLLSRRKRKEQNEIAVYLNNKAIPQVNSLKYLGIIFDHKLTFKEHIQHMAEKCTKLIFSISKSAKLNWGLDHKPLKTIYVGGILPLLTYGAPVWSFAVEKESYKTKLK